VVRAQVGRVLHDYGTGVCPSGGRQVYATRLSGSIWPQGWNEHFYKPKTARKSGRAEQSLWARLAALREKAVNQHRDHAAA
jgi:hypothetical protein